MPAGASDPFVQLCLELLAPLGAVRARRMFGGHGVYVDDCFVAIVAGAALHLKADAESAPRFAAAGGQPFSYQAAGRGRVALGFWSPPAEAMESPALMLPWARLALAAAVQARAARTSARPAGKKAGPAGKAAKRAGRPAARTTRTTRTPKPRPR